MLILYVRVKHIGAYRYVHIVLGWPDELSSSHVTCVRNSMHTHTNYVFVLQRIKDKV